MSPSGAAVTNTPPPGVVASATDPSTGNVVGLVSNPASGGIADTWIWTGTVWKQRQPNGTIPPARSSTAMAYDAATRTVVLFGGQRGSSILGDTFVWNGATNTWADATPAAPAASPPPRVWGTMAYDAATGTVLLFGGSAHSGSQAGQLNDTWAWNGTTKTWALQSVAVSPSPRAFHAMTEDKATRTVVLFSGIGPLGILLDDTWTWNGATKTWTEQSPANSPPPRRFAHMAYDGARGNAVLFGGDNVNSFLTDTWTWNGVTKNWKLRAATNPAPPRGGPAMAYHAGTQKVVLVSDFNGQLQTWTWNGTSWKRPL